VLLLLVLCAIPFALAQRNAASQSLVSQRTLTFAERVTYQRAIEEVYCRHRIWPEHPDPKPSFDAVMPQAQLEKKVAEDLRNSQALEEHWQQPITAEQLQAEMDRMAQHTKQPELLRELFEALGNDPFVIAECLARPVLAQRLVADLLGQGKTSHAHSAQTEGLHTMSKVTASRGYILPKIAQGTPAPTILESAAVPSPAPFPYSESGLLASGQTSYSRTAHSRRRPLTAKTVREAAFKYNGVPDFCGLLAALPADVGVFDPKLGRTRELVEGGRVEPKNVAWFRTHKQGKRP